MSSLVVFGVVVALAAFFGSSFKPDLWYRGLRKPAWEPPDWLFGQAWRYLYVAIAFAGWLVWWANADAWSFPLALWVVLLICRCAWSWLFFGRHAIGAATTAGALLLIAVIGFVATAPDYSPFAAALVVPCAAWAAFAVCLTYTIWRMNRASVHDTSASRLMS